MRANDAWDDEASWHDECAIVGEGGNAAAVLCALPVMEVDIDRIHRKLDDRFDVQISGGRMCITSGAARLELPPHHTRNLMLWLLD